MLVMKNKAEWREMIGCGIRVCGIIHVQPRHNVRLESQSIKYQFLFTKLSKQV